VRLASNRPASRGHEPFAPQQWLPYREPRQQLPRSAQKRIRSSTADVALRCIAPPRSGDPESTVTRAGHAAADAATLPVPVDSEAGQARAPRRTEPAHPASVAQCVPRRASLPRHPRGAPRAAVAPARRDRARRRADVPARLRAVASAPPIANPFPHKPLRSGLPVPVRPSDSGSYPSSRSSSARLAIVNSGRGPR